MILGAVLAGGQSSRFGSDKARALFGDRTLADHAAAQLSPHVAVTVVIGRTGGIGDLPRPGLGPLGGIAGALDHAATHGFDSVVTIGCDMPLLPDGLLEELLRRTPAYCRDTPILGHWPAALGAHVLAHIEGASNRSVRDWARAVGALPIVSAVPIANVNTPEDLLAL